MHGITLEKRQSNCYYNSFGRYTCYNNGWYDYGRWILLGVVLAVFFLLFFCTSCISRRRRRRNQKPFYGTGWMAHGVEPAPAYQQNDPNVYKMNSQPAPAYNNNTGYGNNTNNMYQPPVGPPPNQAYGANAGYYGAGAQESGYAPPAGPPPTHFK